MEVSTREVADALNLPVNVIEALEADDHERLPPTVFTRGYLRSYARLLELPPEPLLARYPEVTGETDAITGELPVTSIPSPAPARTLGIAAVVGVILIVLLVFLLGDDEQPVPEIPEQVRDQPVEAEAVEEAFAESESADELKGRVQQPASVPLTREAVSAVEESVAPREESQGTEAERIPVPAVRTDIRTDDDGNETSAVAESEVSTPVTPSIVERRITEFGDDRLTFVFSEDCWVEVKSSDGENLYSDLNRSGRTLMLTGRAPFRILLGYAPGVSLSFNDAPVQLSRYTRNNVANLVLGESQ